MVGPQFIIRPCAVLEYREYGIQSHSRYGKDTVQHATLNFLLHTILHLKRYYICFAYLTYDIKHG